MSGDLICRGDVDPRNLANPRRLDGVPYTDYERGYNDGIIDAYWLTHNAKAIEAEPVFHARWKLRGGLFRCTHCDAKALWSKNGGTHGYSHEYEQVVAKRCHVCGAHMDEEVADG